MDRLALLDELLVMVRAGEIATVEGNEETEQLLLEIRRIVHESLSEEIYKDITASDTSYFAPEYESWTNFLNYCDGNSDYAAVLKESYTEKELEILWQYSHIMEELTEKKAIDALILAMKQLKMIQLLRKSSVPCDPQQARKIREGLWARIIGVYNQLYE